MFHIFLIIIGKLLSSVSRFFNLGSGSTWPGHVILSLNKNFIKEILRKNQNLKIVLIAGTNGKTTTGKLVRTIFEKNNFSVFQNEAGANLLNGIASSILLHSSILCNLNYNFAIFEIDENTLPLVLGEINPDYILLLNLFRDQLDRYGEVDSIANKWKKSLSTLSKKTILILNADDPLIASLGKDQKTNTLYFGLEEENFSNTKQSAPDTIYCPNCSSKLIFDTIYFSHLGRWRCSKCQFSRPKLSIDNFSFYPLPGLYNRYNTLAAILLAKGVGIKQAIIENALGEFKPAFGRQEKIKIDGKNIQIFLSKNPTSFNESLRTIRELGAKNALFILNDRIPDGKDVSWIWDVDFENLANQLQKITISGDRPYDMGLRIKHAFNETQNYSSKFKIYEDIKDAVKFALDGTEKSQTLYILPTYSAMLDLRKILTGKKIL